MGIVDMSIIVEEDMLGEADHLFFVLGVDVLWIQKMENSKKMGKNSSYTSKNKKIPIKQSR